MTIQSQLDQVLALVAFLGRSCADKTAIPFYTSPTATVDVGALARLGTRWNLQAAECESEARRMEGQSVANELMRDAAQYRQSAFQLAALIGG